MQNFARLVGTEHPREVDEALSDSHIPQLVVDARLRRIEEQQLLVLLVLAPAERRIEDEEALKGDMTAVRHPGRRRRFPARPFQAFPACG